MNKIIISGNLTRDPEIKKTASGINYCSFSVAVNRKEGDEKVTDFYNVTAWRGLGDTIEKHFKKGDKILVMGEISLRNTEKDGVKKLYIDVTATDFEFMSGSGKKEAAEDVEKPAPVAQQPAPIKVAVKPIAVKPSKPTFDETDLF